MRREEEGGPTFSLQPDGTAWAACRPRRSALSWRYATVTSENRRNERRGQSFLHPDEAMFPLSPAHIVAAIADGMWRGCPRHGGDVARSRSGLGVPAPGRLLRGFRLQALLAVVSVSDTVDGPPELVSRYVELTEGRPISAGGLHDGGRGGARRRREGGGAPRPEGAGGNATRRPMKTDDSTSVK
jgi:hypothetical protein